MGCATSKWKRHRNLIVRGSLALQDTSSTQLGPHHQRRSMWPSCLRRVYARIPPVLFSIRNCPTFMSQLTGQSKKFDLANLESCGWRPWCPGTAKWSN